MQTRSCTLQAGRQDRLSTRIMFRVIASALRLVAKLLQKQLDKTEQCSNWAQRRWLFAVYTVTPRLNSAVKSCLLNYAICFKV